MIALEIGLKTLSPFRYLVPNVDTRGRAALITTSLEVLKVKKEKGSRNAVENHGDNLLHMALRGDGNSSMYRR